MGFSFDLRNNHLSLNMKTFISLTCLSLVACSPGGGYHSRTSRPQLPPRTSQSSPSPPPSSQPSSPPSRLPAWSTPSLERVPSPCSPPPTMLLPRSHQTPSTASSLTRTP